ncbi:ribokinase [Enterococcus ureilyticus]|uniref:Ribokinase n=1 Tax=Enterococcus ureilyticus TaxID=1131292 RepID=A0A1E5HGK3_9ENTE|nr:ribokinase [Enterococcus ureilyticus]MBM7689630.1 ribokinase [Enterococcus ureilyticus]OEG24089.1 ribokinase [Enterococcus ureilyticus]
MNKVTIIGSINSDTTLRMKYLPKPGETLHTTELFTSGGGKGANQAIAARRNGAQTAFIGAVGKDDTGKRMITLLEKETIDISGIEVIDNQSTGSAYILLDSFGENSIIIHSGANNHITNAQVKAYQDLIEASDFIIAQFESTLDSTIQAFKLAKQNGVKTILNPAPAFEQIPPELLAHTDLIIPNESEVEILTGIKISSEQSMKEAADYLHNLGIESVVITLGNKGAFYDVKGKSGIIPALKVKAVDTTAAGDTFIGAMVSVLQKDFSNLEEAIKYGTRAAALTVQRFGAQPSIPYGSELL